MVPGSAYPDKLQLMLASRTAPDVMRVDHYIFPSLVRKDYFLPLDPFIAAEPRGFLDDFTPTALDECRWNGNIYAMNVLFGTVLIYYNKTLLAQCGQPDPYQLSKEGQWDWDRFVQVARAVTRHDAGGRALQFGADMVPFPQYAQVIWNNGGEIMNPELTRFVLGDDPKGIDAVQEYADLRWKWRCAPTPSDNALSPFSFESGKIGMHWDWAGVTPRFRKNIGKQFEWDIVPTPTGPAGDRTVLKGNQMTVFRETPHPELAWEFVRFMTGPEAELLLYGKYRRCVPVRISVQNDPRYLKTTEPPFHTDVFLESIRRGRTLPIDARYQEWSQEYNSALDVLFNVGEGDAKQACQAAAVRINAILSGEEGF
jgi:multiple sugar transport system substrate-binding protein